MKETVGQQIKDMHCYRVIFGSLISTPFCTVSVIDELQEWNNCPWDIAEVCSLQIFYRLSLSDFLLEEDGALSPWWALKQTLCPACGFIELTLIVFPEYAINAVLAVELIPVPMVRSRGFFCLPASLASLLKESKISSSSTFGFVSLPISSSW